MRDPIILTRQEVYDQVWSRPMTKVAADYGISDVALKKICDKHRIPVPGRGYWAKRQNGQGAPQVRLRQVSDAQIDRIVIQGSHEASLPDEVRAAKEVAVAAEKAPEKKIVVADPPSPNHILAKRTARVLSKAKPDERGLLIPSGPDTLPVAVRSARVPRALNILDALATAVEERGYLTGNRTAKGSVYAMKWHQTTVESSLPGPRLSGGRAAALGSLRSSAFSASWQP